MDAININNFIYTPASFFEIRGKAAVGDTSQNAVPCRIKVGPRRFLEVRVYPKLLTLLLWLNEDDHITYVYEPVDAVETEDGTLFIDAVALARKYFGNDLTFCDSEFWKQFKNTFPSDCFMHTECGLAMSHTVRTDHVWNLSGLYMKPGALKMNGRNVLTISWSSNGEACAAHEEALFSLTEEILNEPHNVTTSDVLQELERREVIQEYGINRVQALTDHGKFIIDASPNGFVSVILNDQPEMAEEYRPTLRCRSLEQVEIMLELLQASSVEEVQATLTHYHQLGLLTKFR